MPGIDFSPLFLHADRQLPQADADHRLPRQDILRPGAQRQLGAQRPAMRGDHGRLPLPRHQGRHAGTQFNEVRAVSEQMTAELLFGLLALPYEKEHYLQI